VQKAAAIVFDFERVFAAQVYCCCSGCFDYKQSRRRPSQCFDFASIDGDPVLVCLGN